jgi:hypothetical protein
MSADFSMFHPPPRLAAWQYPGQWQHWPQPDCASLSSGWQIAACIRQLNENQAKQAEIELPAKIEHLNNWYNCKIS